MLNLGVPEMLVILVVALIVFGPNRLPEIARSMGKFIRNFQAETNRAINDLKQGIEPATAGIFDEPDPGTPAEPMASSAIPPTQAIATAPARSHATRRAKAGSPKKPATARKRPAPKRPATTRKAAPKKKAAARKSPRRA